jgi:hypothetical protein
MRVPMTRVERARGHRIVAVAHAILVIAPALSRRAGPITTSGDHFAHRADRAWLTRGPSLTLTTRPRCDLEGPRRSLIAMDYRSVRIEMAQRRIRHNRG